MRCKLCFGVFLSDAGNVTRPLLQPRPLDVAADTTKHEYSGTSCALLLYIQLQIIVKCYQQSKSDCYVIYILSITTCRRALPILGTSVFFGAKNEFSSGPARRINIAFVRNRKQEHRNWNYGNIKLVFGNKHVWWLKCTKIQMPVTLPESQATTEAVECF